MVRNKKKKKSILNIIYKFIYFLFFPLTLVMVSWAEDNTDKVEMLYSRKIYPVVSQIVTFASSPFAWSVAEIIFYIAIIIVPLGLILTLASNKNTAYKFFNYIVTIIAVASVGYFLFYGLWGLNYYRQPLSEIMGLEIEEVSSDELVDLCEDLINDANELSNLQETNRNDITQLPYSLDLVFEKINEAYREMGEEIDIFKGNYSNPKDIWLSEKMCYTEVTGIFIPFTCEANVNTAIMPMMIGATAAHESAHQRGLAREDEANFASYLVLSNTDDDYLKYSGTILALIHSMNELYKYDKDEFTRLKQMYNDRLRTDLRANSEFWKQYEGKIAETATEVNNAYLEHNDQEDGVRSYGRMVDLLLAYRRAEIGESVETH